MAATSRRLQWSGAKCSPQSLSTTSCSLLRANSSRLWDSMMEMATIGAFDGPEESKGVCREALTDPGKEGRLLLDRWTEELGLLREMDQVGNTFYRRKSSAS